MQQVQSKNLFFPFLINITKKGKKKSQNIANFNAKLFFIIGIISVVPE